MLSLTNPQISKKKAQNFIIKTYHKKIPIKQISVRLLHRGMNYRVSRGHVQAFGSMYFAVAQLVERKCKS